MQAITSFNRLLRTLLCCMAVAVSAFPAYGAIPDSAKTFMRLIDKYDPGIIPSSPDSTTTPAFFWKHVVNNSEHLKQARRDIEKRGKTARAVRNRMMELPHFRRTDILLTVDSLQPAVDSIALSLGFDKRYCETIVINHTWRNIITALSDRGGFALLVNMGALQAAAKSDTTGRITAAIMARAYAHGVMLHHLRHFYNEENRLNRITLWVSIASILMPSTARAAERMLLPSDYDWSRRRYGDDYLRNIDAEAATFYFPFSDELEIEADIIAYRFMEWMGFGGDAYIESIRHTDIDNSIDFYSMDALSDAAQFRIALLQFMRSHPNLKKYRKDQHRRTLTKDPIYD